MRSRFGRLSGSILMLLAAAVFAVLALVPAIPSMSQVIRSAPKPIPPEAVYMQPVPGLTHSQLQKFKSGE